MENSKSTETIKMLDRALLILDVLRKGQSQLGVNEIAKKFRMNPSTVFRILQTLKTNGWVYQCSDGRYISGQKLSFQMEKNNLNLALRDVSFTIMERYTMKYGQAMNLLVRDGAHCHILQQSRTKNLVDYVPPVFSELPFYASAGGKVLFCELPMSLLEQIISSRELIPLTRNTIIDAQKFLQELEKVKEQGYAFDNHESAENGSCIAVPVRDSEGNIIAALSFSGFIGIRNIEDLLTYLPTLQDASSEIKSQLFNCWGHTCKANDSYF